MKPQRRRKNTLRLVGFNYQTPSMYTIVISTANNTWIFGEVVDAKMQPSKIGQIVLEQWAQIPQIHPDVVLDVYQLMPTHFHAIVQLTRKPTHDIQTPMQVDNEKSAAARCLLPHSLSTLISSFKRGVTIAVRKMYDDPTFEVWHKNYHDLVIRSDEHLHNARAYILRNPEAWEKKYGKGAME